MLAGEVTLSVDGTMTRCATLAFSNTTPTNIGLLTRQELEI